MSLTLKQSTAVTVQVGPFLSISDGFTPVTGATPTVYLSKNGAAYAARNSAGAIAHDRDGWYTVPLDTTDTGTAGILRLEVTNAASYLPVWHEFMVLPALVYDSLIAGTDNLQTDLVQWKGSTPSDLISGRVDSNVQASASGLTFNLTGNVSGSVGSVSGAVGSVTGNVGGNVSGSVASVVGNVDGNVAGSVASVTAPVTVGTNNDKTGYALSAAGIQAIWDALTSALTTAGSIGKLLVDNINATISSRLASASYTAPPSAATISAAVWAESSRTLTAFGFTVNAAITSISSTIRNQIADNVLRRSLASAEASADGDTLTFRSALGAAAKLVNRLQATGGNLLTYKTDDSTVLGTQAITTDASADPITQLDTSA